MTLPKKEPNAYLHDRHYIEGATRHALANAHEKDLQAQNKYGVNFLTYWFDEARSTAFCLVEAPSREAIQRTHEEAHGAVPNEIIEVNPTVVEAFLGRLTDPLPSESGAGKVSVDADLPGDHVHRFERLDGNDDPAGRNEGPAFAQDSQRFYP